MAMKFAGYLVLALVAASVFATAMAHKNGQAGYATCPPCPCGGGGGGGGGGWWPPMPAPKRVIVGGSEKWHFGYNYSDWAMKSPFFVGDTLVFFYTQDQNGHDHSVYLLPNVESYINCDLTNAIQIGKPGGGANGVKFKLTAKKFNEGQYFYFACGEGPNRLHCNGGMMKFIVYAWPRAT